MDDKVSVIIVAVIFYGFAFLCWFKPDDDISAVERRKLTQKPELTIENVMSGEYMEDFEEYAVDQIPFRQPLRGLKAIYSTYVMGQLDSNGLYIKDGYIIKHEYPLDEESLDYAARRFGYVYDKYLKETDVNAYLSIIPDKNYFNNNDIYPETDYDKMVRIMCDNMEYAEYIDIMSVLELEDYYKTDTHWRQENLILAAQRLGQGMGVNISSDYESVKLDKTFYGVYYGQMALPVSGDDLYYLTNAEIQGCQVYDYENSREISMYDLSAVDSSDNYNMYLYGPLSLITITNPNGALDKELIIFRDSFGSSIAPLLVSGYSKITLVDIRYLSIDILGQFVEFDNQDVLFLYSTSVLNNSETIK